jgi:hypothetical protein
MNDIYWHGKRPAPPKQFSAPPPTQPRRSYENTLQSKHYQQVDVHSNSHSTTGRPVTSPYTQYPTVSDRSHNNNVNFPYASSLHGVYRRSPPNVITSPSPLHSNQNKHIDLQNHSYRAQQRQISRSASEDYYTTKHQESHGFNDENYDDEEANEDDYAENSCENFNYTYNDRGVSLNKRKYSEICVKLISFVSFHFMLF